MSAIDIYCYLRLPWNPAWVKMAALRSSDSCSLELRTSKEHDPQSRKLAGWLKSEVYVSGTTRGWYKVDRLDCRLSLMLDRETKRYRQAIRHASLGRYQW